MYSGQKPRLGIWALAQARAESARIILPNMSDDDLPRTPIVASTFIYIKQERWPRSYPLCVTHVLVLLRYSPRLWPSEQTVVIGQWCAYESLGKSIGDADQEPEMQDPLCNFRTNGTSRLATPALTGTALERGLPTPWNANGFSD